MNLNDLDFLKELDHLKRIKQEASGTIDTSELEREFLRFSQPAGQTIRVKRPRLYRLDKDDLTKYLATLKTIGAQFDKGTWGVSISGDPDGSISDKVIFLSIKQLNADHSVLVNSYLNPLLENILTAGAGMIRDFSIHEAIFGNVTAMRGGLDLKEAHLFPGKFTSGPYTLETKLDTPSKGITAFGDLKAMLAQLEQHPHPNVLDPQYLSDMATKGAELRKKYGALARYEVPDTQTFSAETDAAYLKIGRTELFYLYNAKDQQNTVVFFGDNIFHSKYRPNGLSIINGEEHQYALSELTAQGYFTPSEAILDQRIKDLSDAQDTAIRALGVEAQGSEGFAALMSELETAKSFLYTIRNPEMRAGYFAKKAPELLEFAVVPKDNNPLLHAILPRLSWSKAMRDYHNTGMMKERLDSASPDERKTILAEIASNVLFRNQQNYDLNNYIADKYSAECKQANVNITSVDV